MTGEQPQKSQIRLPLTASTMFKSLGLNINPDWLTDYTQSQLRQQCEKLVAHLHSTQTNNTDAAYTTVGKLPAVRIHTEELREHTPTAQLMNWYNAIPLAPRVHSTGSISFEVLPQPNFRSTAINHIQTHNHSAPTQSYTLTITGALRQAGFADGTVVSHSCRPGEISLKETAHPFADSSNLIPAPAQPATYEEELDRVTNTVATEASDVTQQTERHPPEVRFSVTPDRASLLFQKLHSLPTHITEILVNQTENLTLEIRLRVMSSFQSMDSQTKIREKTDSMVVTVTQSAQQSGLITDENQEPRLSVYSRPGELRITRTTPRTANQQQSHSSSEN